jgi:hypothetical protein
VLPQSLPGLWLVIHQRIINPQDNSFPGDNSGLEPPDPISNSEVKRTSANDSVRFPHVKVGHRQGFILKSGLIAAFFLIFFNLLSLSRII